MVDDDFIRLYERMDWFLKWLGNTCPDTFPYIAQEWLRSDPECTGTWVRNLVQERREKPLHLFNHNIGKPCKKCGIKLTTEDMLNSLYGTHYSLCRECASKISV